MEKKTQQMLLFLGLAFAIVAAAVGLVLAAVSTRYLRILQDNAAGAITVTGGGSANSGIAAASDATGAGAGSSAAVCADPLLGELRAFYREAVISNRLFIQTGRWEDFQEAIPDLESPRSSNLYLRKLADLRERALRGPNPAAYRRLVRELELYYNLTSLDALFMHTGPGLDSLRPDPWRVAADTLPILAAHAQKPDFAARVFTWLSNLAAFATRYAAAAARAAQAGHVHAHFMLSQTYDSVTGPALSADYNTFCASVFASQNNMRSVCQAYTGPLEQRLADLRSWWLETYIPRAGVVRPDTAPGTMHPDVIEILFTYHYGAPSATIAANTTASMLPASNAQPGLSDTSNTSLYQCVPLGAAADAHVRASLALVAERTVTPLFGFGPRISIGAHVSSEPSSLGDYNSSIGAWTKTPFLSVIGAGRCVSAQGNAQSVWLPLSELAVSTVVRDGVPGQRFRRALISEQPLGCLPRTEDSFLLDAEMADARAWATLVDSLVAQASELYTVPLVAAGYRRSLALDSARLYLDISRVFVTLDDARLVLGDVGLTSAEIDREIVEFLQRPGLARAAAAIVADHVRLLSDSRAPLQLRRIALSRR